MNLQGIYFGTETQRFYPKGKLAAGHLGWILMDKKGRAELSPNSDSRIRGRAGRKMMMRTRTAGFEGSEQSAQAGSKVVLTLDQNIQFIVEKALTQAIETTAAQKGTVIVEDTASGEMLAMRISRRLIRIRGMTHRRRSEELGSWVDVRAWIGFKL